MRHPFFLRSEGGVGWLDHYSNKSATRSGTAHRARGTQIFSQLEHPENLFQRGR